MNEYLILFVLLAVSLLILGLLVRMFLKMKRVEDTAEVRAVELEPSERVAPEADLQDIEEDAEEEREEEAPRKQAPG
jgi:flagellar biosynthesis/type III secretory pathway M-ring protein FliF/YscJ